MCPEAKDFQTCNEALCHGCKIPGARPLIHCKECFGDALLCDSCCVRRHAENPLHMIELQRWNGQFCERTSLKALGLRIQLGHPLGETCPDPQCAHSEFVVTMDICNCEHAATAGAPEIQMLCARWFPVTDDKPKTCATMSMLDHFLMATLQSKTTLYDYYAALKKLTDNTGSYSRTTVKPPYRYHAFLRMCREYQHLLMLERAGRGHEPSGVTGTKAGELAVQCPCCPHPGVNLVDGWENASPEDAFMFILFLALDTELKDPPLSEGWAYMVERVPYRAFLMTVTDQKEMSTCSGLAVLDHANTKFSRGYSATGVGMGVCARHEFIQPNSVGDLQKGEHCINMDYIFASILRYHDPRLLKIISYDIVCQWWKNLLQRLKKLPPLMHIHGHTMPCQLLFSLNLVLGSAQTNGEGIERPWANIRGVATSTREMGPGLREDVLNCHWGHWNWLKLLGVRARAEYAAQLESFTTFLMQQSECVPAWLKMVQDFEKDGKNLNPYEAPFRGKCERREMPTTLTGLFSRMTEAQVLL
ncbi:hypothetical protein C8R44DRAFT_833320 [Mycena epipterygia]|nr:hypothetical protein C8R44DRAFT_833320 [Mycena epipterygia]